MRDLFKILTAGIVIFFSPFVIAQEQYKVVVIPDNIVTETAALDSYIYNAAAEFFANEVVNILNKTDYIKAPTVSEERALLKSSPYLYNPAKALTNKFKTSYNIDHVQLKKIVNKSQARYALLITSYLDSENYILRRTFWDFLNIPGATVVDPAYKICTYAALVDTQNNAVLWSNTFYKTISVVENRIITRGPSPQTEQLQKIRDYSRMLCPEIAQSVQQNILPPEVYEKESQQIYYDMANFDNVFTKKYRRWHKEGGKDYNAAKTKVNNSIDNTKEKYNNYQEERKQRALEKAKSKEEKELQKQLEVKAEPVLEPLKQEVKTEEISKPAAEVTQETKTEKNIFNINFKKTETPELEDQSLYIPLDIKKTKKNNLYGEFDSSRPPLRDYNY